MSPWQHLESRHLLHTAPCKGRASVCGGTDSFLCATGICVHRNWLCSEKEFRCGTGRCVNTSLLCDSYDDCGDLSDEHNCKCDHVKEHQCGDGRCVPLEWVCDGDHDCLDKSDELNCSQGLLECKSGQCIPSAFRCDGEEDCKDGSDEENCTKQQFHGSCPPDQPSCISTACSPGCGGGGGGDGAGGAGPVSLTTPALTAVAVSQSHWSCV
ncbi:hypothetical protein Q7C36_018740 [Tachysurus vachellii]|uniref:Uncharacterized protein n=1 Tax=Tachysurus vachellii TaxID=175792 RepID=A0AA88LV26_TACVA|nr:hypothetical protein Q7C36_018740 [Tachysurus vachellii]